MSKQCQLLCRYLEGRWLIPELEGQLQTAGETDGEPHAGYCDYSDGCIVRHTIDAGGGDRNRIAFGPTGLFLIDTKERHGRCAVDAGALRTSYRFSTDERPMSDELSRRYKARALELSAGRPACGLPALGPARSRDLSGLAEAGGTERLGHFIHGDQLREWLKYHEPRDRSSEHCPPKSEPHLQRFSRDGIAPLLTDRFRTSEFSDTRLLR